MTKQKCYEVVVIGACGVGKSALTMQYDSHVFLDFHEPTIEDSEAWDNLDTQDDLQSALSSGEAFVGVYSITDASSFHALRKQILTMKSLYNTDNIPLVIVANKLDMFNDREISSLDGIALAREFDCPFYEASAANGVNVEDTFNGLIRKISAREEAASNCNLKKPKLKRFRKYVCKKIQNMVVL